MRTKLAVVITLSLLVSLTLAAAPDQKLDIPLRNWPVAFDRVIARETAPGRFVAATNAVSAGGTTYVPITPCRLFDTRATTAPLNQGGGIFSVVGAARLADIPAMSAAAGCTVPAAAGYSFNFTIAGYNNRGNIKAYPNGATAPITTVVNLGSGLPVANSAIVAADSNGKILIELGAGTPQGSTQLILDLNGYFTDAATSLNVPNTLVLRDANGDFSARIITGEMAVKGAVYQDLAEWVPSPALQPGMLVVLDPADGRRVMASSHAYDTSVAGVVSHHPAIILGDGGPDKSQIATTGRVKVFVDADIAPIRVGDLLVASDIAGTAMRSMPMSVDGHSFHRPGTIVGKALQPLASGKGEILILLSLQ